MPTDTSSIPLIDILATSGTPSGTMSAGRTRTRATSTMPRAIGPGGIQNGRVISQTTLVVVAVVAAKARAEVAATCRAALPGPGRRAKQNWLSTVDHLRQDGARLNGKRISGVAN